MAGTILMLLSLLAAIVESWATAGPKFRALSSCTQDTTWTSNNPAAIKSWIQSVVPTFHMEDPDVYPDLATSFIDGGQMTRPVFIVQNAYRDSVAWRALGHRPIDGWLYGTFHPATQSFDAVAYIYDNFQLAILGRFQDDKLVEGSASQISAYRYIQYQTLYFDQVYFDVCRCKDGIMELQFGSDKVSAATFSYLAQSHVTNISTISNEATDPLDEFNVRVAISSIADAGQGLFAKRDIIMGSTIALYSGQMITNLSRILKGKNVELQESLHRNWLNFNKTHVLDVPEPYDQLAHYAASLGHKANHSFKKFNARFGFIKTPR